MTGIILAGGRNSRMGGTNKAFLEIDGTRIIERTVGLFKDIFQEVIIVANDPLSYLYLNTTIVTDIMPDKGALGGLYTGLFWAPHPQAFVCACDMPFLQEDFINYMIGQASPYEIVVPDGGDGLQPLHAIYAKSCLPAIKHNLEQGRPKITAFYKGRRMLTIHKDVVNTFDPTHKMFMNVNTYEDLQNILPLCEAGLA